MSEIEKMYELTNVQPQYKKRIECKEGYSVGQPCGESPCIDCDKSVFKDVMPPFTAEKQIELIKWLCQKTYRNYIHIRYERDINNWKIECNMVGIREFGNFDECFAGLINNLWQDLTEEERKQIKEILK